MKAGAGEQKESNYWGKVRRSLHRQQKGFFFFSSSSKVKDLGRKEPACLPNPGTAPWLARKVAGFLLTHCPVPPSEGLTKQSLCIINIIIVAVVIVIKVCGL